MPQLRYFSEINKQSLWVPETVLSYSFVRLLHNKGHLAGKCSRFYLLMGLHFLTKGFPTYFIGIVTCCWNSIFHCHGEVMTWLVELHYDALICTHIWLQSLLQWTWGMKSGHQQTFVALIAVVDVDWRVHQEHAVTMDEMQETWIYFFREVLCAAFKCSFLYHLSISSKSQQGTSFIVLRC